MPANIFDPHRRMQLASEWQYSRFFLSCLSLFPGVVRRLSRDVNDRVAVRIESRVALSVRQEIQKPFQEQ